MRTGQDEEENDEDERTKFNGGGLTSCKNYFENAIYFNGRRAWSQR